MIQPHVPSAPDRYCRLFAPSGESQLPDARDKKLFALARSMESNNSSIPNECWDGKMVGAGYTYFGQFVDHDLTEDRTSLRQAGLMEPKDTENRRTCWLDLDSLYGHGPGCSHSEDLYEANGLSFRLGEPRVNGQAFDAPLTNGRPRLADDRNNENIIVRQIHVMFLKLHNLAVIELEKTTPRLPRPDLFNQARERVRWQYQWLVRHDFLKTICNDTVYRDVIEKGQRTVDWSKGFSIPVEFSQAAFRFGHSMVRFEYNLNAITRHVPLGDLFGMMNLKALRPEFAVDWNEFLKDETSMRIDTSVVKPLFNLPEEDISRFVSLDGRHTSRELPYRTLYRGAATRLPAGQQVRDQLSPDAVIQQPKCMANDYDPWKTLRELNLENQTPLWYYILLEAEIDENGLRLGRVGSRLVLEVIEGSLRADPNSFINRFGDDWIPPAWRQADGGEFPIRRLLDLAKYVGLARDGHRSDRNPRSPNGC